MRRAPRIALAAIGLLLTPVYWGIVVLFLFMNIIGECPSFVKSCPSDTERLIRILAALIGGTVFYGLAIAAWRKLDDHLAGRAQRVSK